MTVRGLAVIRCVTAVRGVALLRMIGRERTTSGPCGWAAIRNLQSEIRNVHPGGRAGGIFNL
jgi:hypothetical protein